MASVPICEYEIKGNPNGRTLFFIHGWPDDSGLWDQLSAELTDDYRCVLVNLPNFGPTAVKAGGFSFPELVEILAATIRKVQKGGRVTLITHDWGAYIGYLLEQTHPELIEAMVSMDVGGHVEKSGLKKVLMILSYQWALVFCWLIGGLVPPLGGLFSRIVARVVRVPPERRPFIRSRFNYPYFYLWRGMLLPWQRRSILGRYTPGCPVLYLYGRRKPFMFHSSLWLELVAQSGGRAVGFEGGHWFMLTCAEQTRDAIENWLAD